MNQKLIIVAPSGGGKKTLIKRIVEVFPDIFVARSGTTRGPGEGESAGVDYDFNIPRDVFQRMIEENKFFEVEEYCGHLYGTPRDQVEREGFVLIEADYRGALTFMAAFSEARSLFIYPPSRQVLEERLRGRKRGDTEEAIDRRLKRAAEEMGHAERLHFFLENDDLEVLVGKVVALVATMRVGLEPRAECFRDLSSLRAAQATFAGASCTVSQ